MARGDSIARQGRRFGVYCVRISPKLPIGSRKMARRMTTLLLLWGLLVVAGCRPTTSSREAGPSKPSAVEEVSFEGRFIDLTHTYDESTIYWPTADGFKLHKDAAGVTDKGYYYAANSFTTAEHGGTHIDAPIHFFADRNTVDEIPLQQLMGPAVVIDVQDACADDRDYEIGVADLRNWEEKHQRQLTDVIVLLRTGHSKLWGDREKYLGTNKVGEEAVRELHFPGLAPEAAKWLVEQRAPLAVGIDTPSIDFGQSTHFQTHVTLFEHNVPALENVNLIEDLPPYGFTVLALPMKIGGGSGGPTRIVAVLPD